VATFRRSSAVWPSRTALSTHLFRYSGSTAPTPVTIDEPNVTVADRATVTIECQSAQTITFGGDTGTLILNNAADFVGEVKGLSGSDALDFADVPFGPDTQAIYLGNATSGVLTVTNGEETANVTLDGDYLSSSWGLSADASEGTVVVDPVAPKDWQPLKVGAGGFVTGIDIAPDGTTVVRTDTNGAYIWNGSEWQQLVTSTSMPASIVGNGTGTGVYEIQIARLSDWWGSEESGYSTNGG
jgi:hypothetical protein